jgi:hypothetical protein
MALLASPSCIQLLGYGDPVELEREAGTLPGGDGASATDVDGSSSADAGANVAGEGGRAFIAVGERGRRLVSTDDGRTWSNEVLDRDDAGLTLSSVSYGDGRFVAAGVKFGSTFRTDAPRSPSGSGPWSVGSASSSR